MNTEERVLELVEMMIRPLKEVCNVMQVKLSDGPFILQRKQWNRLVVAYFELLSQIRETLRSLIRPLVISLHHLLRVMKAAENSLDECVAPHVRGYFREFVSGSTPIDEGYNYVWQGPNLNEERRKDLRLWTVKHALKHILDCEVPHRHIDNLRTTSMVVQAFLPLNLTRIMESFSKGIPSGDVRGGIYDMDNGEARAFFSHEEIVNIDSQISLLLLHRLRDGMRGEDPDAAVERLAVDPFQFQKCDNGSGNVGEGGFGSVKSKKWISDDHLVAVKKGNIRPEEIRIQARVRHPNLLPLLCCTRKIGTDNQNSFGLVMERMDCNLENMIHNDTLQLRRRYYAYHDRVEIMLQIAKGMEYLHRHDIIHRDLKPANILVSIYSNSDDPLQLRVKVADFGTSKDDFRTSDPSITYKVGTRYYRAPEVVDEESKAGYSRKADVYSFAMVCYSILTGKEPFEGDSRPEYVLRQMIRHEELRPKWDKIRHGALGLELDFDCVSALKGMVEECWHCNPWRRPDFSMIADFLRFVKICALLRTFYPLRVADALDRFDLFRTFCDTGSNVDQMLRRWFPNSTITFPGRIFNFPGRSQWA